MKQFDLIKQYDTKYSFNHIFFLIITKEWINNHIFILHFIVVHRNKIFVGLLRKRTNLLLFKKGTFYDMMKTKHRTYIWQTLFNPILMWPVYIRFSPIAVHVIWKWKTKVNKNKIEKRHYNYRFNNIISSFIIYREGKLIIFKSYL